MKIVLADPFSGGHHGRYLALLTEAFTQHGDSVVVVGWSPHPTYQDAERRGAAIVYAQSDVAGFRRQFALRRAFAMRRFARFALELARDDGADVLHHMTVDRMELAIGSSLSKRAAGDTPRVFGSLFRPHFTVEARNSLDPLRSVWRRLNGRSLRSMLRDGRLDGLFVFSPLIKEQISDEFNNPAAAKRIIPVPDPVDVPASLPSADEARGRLSLPIDRPIVLFFGDQRSNKGLDVLQESITEIGEDSVVVIAGPADDQSRTRLEEWRSSLPDRSRVELRPGWTSDEEMSLFFSAATLAVLPYRPDQNGTSGILQHAAAHARPVVVSDVGVIGPTVRKHGLGIVVAPESPSALAAGIDSLLSATVAERDQIGSRAREYALSCESGIMAGQVRDAYLRAIE